MRGMVIASLLLGCTGGGSNTSQPAPTISPTVGATTFDAHPAPDSATAALYSVTGTLELIGPQPAPSTQQLRVRATVTNHAHQSFLLPVVALSLGQLSLNIFDANGTRIHSTPPPVPRPDDDRREALETGKSRIFELTLDIFSPTLKAGRYVATWGARNGIVGATTAFVIGS